MLNALLSRPRRLLATLALILAATGVVIGSGASFTSESANADNIFSSGSLKQENSKPGAAIFTTSNMKPGDTYTGTVTIKNSGSLASAFTLTESGFKTGFTTTPLKLVVTDTAVPGTPVYNGDLGGLGANRTLTGTFAAGTSRTYTFKVTFPDTGVQQNLDQDKSATATYTWNATQTTARDFDDANQNVQANPNNNAVK